MAVAVRARVAAGVVEVAGWVMVAMAMVVAWEARAVRRGWVARMVVDPVEAARRAVMGWRVVVGWEEAEAAVGRAAVDAVAVMAEVVRAAAVAVMAAAMVVETVAGVRVAVEGVTVRAERAAEVDWARGTGKGRWEAAVMVRAI